MTLDGRASRMFRSPLVLASAILVTIFLVELLLMALLWGTLPPMDPFTHALVDALSLALIATPVVYFLVFNPMRRHISSRQESEERYRRLVESSVDAIVSCDEGRRIVGWNPAAEDMFGYSSDEVVEKQLDDLLVPDAYRDGHVEGYQRFLETGDGVIMGRTVEIEAKRKGGETLPVEMSLSAARIDGSFRFTAIIRDITDRKRMEVERELLFGVTKAVHEAADFDEALDRSLKEIFDRTGWIYGEIWVPNGETGLLELTATRHGDEGRLDRFEEASRGASFGPGEGLPGRVWSSREPEWIRDVSTQPESRFLRTSLAEEAGLRAALAVPATSDGEVVAVLVFFMFEVGERDAQMVDLVKAVARELGMTLKRRRLEEEVERSRDELEVLNRIVRHDIRNDMQIVTGWGEMLYDHVDDEGEEILEKVLGEAQHVIELTFTARDYMEVILDGEGEAEVVDLSSVLESELDEVRRHFGGVEVEAEGVPHGVEVRAGPLLHSVFRNLLHNAVQHNDKEVPKITVTVEEVGDAVVVSVADNGPGIPEELRPRLFGMGEKGLESEGTGVGLYLVKMLVEQYGGEVEVEDSESGGSVFRVRLVKAESGGVGRGDE